MPLISSEISARARSLLHGAEGFNCAQSVLKAFQDICGIENGTISSFKAYGGGRAPGNECGAYYAAKHILNDQKLEEELRNEFVLEGGSFKCTELKEDSRLECKDCVALAASFVEENVKILL